MSEIPATVEAFNVELSALRQRFQAMQPELEVTVRDPAMGVEGFVVVWNTGISRGGPLHNCGKGGTRVMKDLKLEDIRRLARAMAEKNAAAGLPLGGAKSGLRLDPSDPEYEKKYRRFVELCAPFLFERGGIFGGFGYDVGCLPPHNAVWACDQLKSTRSFTGKPVEMGGTDYDREGIAGLGVATAAKVLIEENGETVAGRTFSVQGAGAMGAAVVRYFSAYGGVLRCIADPKYGGTWVLNGLPSDTLVAALSHQRKDEAAALLIVEAHKISDDSAQALYAEFDVVFPCAVEDVLRADNADRVRAHFIVEGANNPTTEEAHRSLFEKGVKVVPDIIANSGGIIAAFVELTSVATLEENLRTRVNVIAAKELTVQKVTENVQRLCSLTRTLGVAGDQAGDYMAYRNIFFGL
jgi:glutamate dehydrogenase/leucine dehydrogenase